MRKLWIIICVLAMPCVASAQSNQAWENLSTLQAGQKIQVVETNSKKESGTFVSVSDTAISVQGKAGARTIDKKDVRSVKLMKHAHRLRNTLVLGGVGAGVGAGIAAGASPGKCGPSTPYCVNPLSKGAYAGIGAVVGLVGGAIVGALWPSHQTVYHAKAQ